jgi:mannose-6-phosphate isomerase
MKFVPIFKDKIWGGQKIKSVLGKDFSPLSNCGEVWVLSGVENNQTRIQNGFLKSNELNEVLEVYMGDLVGDQIYQKFGNEFPILIKFIDANDWLSIQVHPDDELAWKRHQSLGKSEMWYILDAEKDAQLISGFSQQINKDQYQQHLESKTLKNVMNFEKVSKGDVYFMPAGRVHALGPGVLLAEVQQTSDVTYRIYDWDRIDETGMMRELHIKEALDAIDFKVYDQYKSDYESKQNATVNLVESPYFITGLIHMNQALKKDYSELDSFVIYVCVEGQTIVKHKDVDYTLNMGEVMLLPAIIDKIEFYPQSECKLLEVFMLLS